MSLLCAPNRGVEQLVARWAHNPKVVSSSLTPVTQNPRPLSLGFFILQNMSSKLFKSGFVSIVGKPNVGKSTLMNRLVGEQLSITTPKAQTTRHRIMGILNGEDYQIVYSDTPGILEPKYALHEAMMSFVKVSLEDADLILLVVALEDKYEPELFERFKRIQTPLLLIINKIDLAKGSQVLDKSTYWKEHLPNLSGILPVSATSEKTSGN